MANWSQNDPQWINNIPQWVEAESDQWVECGWSDIGWVEGDHQCIPASYQWVECGWADLGWIEGDEICPAVEQKETRTGSGRGFKSLSDSTFITPENYDLTDDELLLFFAAML